MAMTKKAGMSFIQTLTGVLIISFVLIDALWTTLWSEGGAGPLTNRLSTLIWKIFIRTAKRNHLILSLAGPVVLVFNAIQWMVFLWIGWTLIFYANGNSVFSSDTMNTANLQDTIWFVGYSLVTLGNGDFVPKQGVWQILTTLVVASGMSILSISITYFFSVISAVVNKASFASQVFSLGASSSKILLNSWTGEKFEGLEIPLNTYSALTAKITRQYLAYPILKYFHPKNSTSSEILAIAVLSELVTILKTLPREIEGPSNLALISVENTIHTYLETLELPQEYGDGEPPPPPDLIELQKAGLDFFDHSEFDLNFDGNKRKRLASYLKLKGWKWPE